MMTLTPRLMCDSNCNVVLTPAVAIVALDLALALDVAMNGDANVGIQVHTEAALVADTAFRDDAQDFSISLFVELCRN